MDAWVLINGVAGIASIAGFVGGYFTGRYPKQKCLVYDVSDVIPLATAVEGDQDYEISVAYGRTGLRPIQVKGVYVRYIRLANIGREPVKGSDAVEADPLRLKVSGCRVLDILLDKSSRSACKVALQSTLTSETEAEATVDFSFLDYQDGLVLRLLTDEVYPEIRIKGTVIGMPRGCRPLNLLPANRAARWLMLPLLFVLPFFALFLANWATQGSALPQWAVTASSIAGTIAGFVAAFLVCNAITVDMPSTLSLPHFAHSFANSKFLEAVSQMQREGRHPTLPNASSKVRAG